MMWLEAIFSSLLLLSALILFFEAPFSSPQDQLNFYEYTYLSDNLLLALNSNFSNFCESKDENFCTKCSIKNVESSLSITPEFFIPNFDSILTDEKIQSKIKESNLDFLNSDLVDVEDKEVFSSEECKQHFLSKNIKKSLTTNHLIYIGSGLKKISFTIFYPYT